MRFTPALFGVWFRPKGRNTPASREGRDSLAVLGSGPRNKISSKPELDGGSSAAVIPDHSFALLGFI